MATISSLIRKLFVFLELVSNQLAMLCFIANLTTINQTRPRTGIKGDLEPKGFIFIYIHRSDRLRSFAQKRQFNSLKGLISPCKRKREVVYEASRQKG